MRILIIKIAVSVLLTLVFHPAAWASREVTINHADGTPFFRLLILSNGESADYDDRTYTADRDLPQADLDGLRLGASYISALLEGGLSGAVPLIILQPDNAPDDNAFAASITGSPYITTQLGDMLLYGTGDSRLPAGVIGIDRTSPDSSGWQTDCLPVLPNNGMKSDLPGTMSHELFHALGLTAYVVSDQAAFVPVYGFGDWLNNWSKGLRDIYGTAAAPLMPIAGISGAPLPESPDTGSFYMRDSATAGTYGGAYFTGKHVEEVLQGALLAWPNDSTTAPVPGLPVNGFEGQDPELSHIELQNSLMSHQGYRNWATFMEAELAVLQDLGYTFDRRRFFGNSIYGSGSEGSLRIIDNTAPYFARNAAGDGWREGEASPQDWGIGLHIYGSWNDVSQSADLLSTGQWGIGIRMDGTGNRLAVAPGVRVYADGAGGNGLLVAYGRNHELTVQGDVQALGAGGVAARFDFGSNELGDYYEYRGSYIRTWLGKGLWRNDPLLDALNGALVSQFNLTGRLAGSAAAIYIAPNALVEHIDIMKGASLQGDIISEWNPGKPLYPGMVIQAPAGTDLSTELAFGRKPDAEGRATGAADPSFSLGYNGNISGPGSMVMAIRGGALSYNGQADVLTVLVDEGARLSGNGAYVLNRPAVAISATDGVFVNAGTLAPGNSPGAITIDGDYQQTATGVLQAGFDARGKTNALTVSGGAALNGTLLFTPLMDYFNGSVLLGQPLSAGSTSGSFTATALSVSSPTLSMSLDAAANTVYTSRPQRAYSRYARSANSAALGRVVDVIAGNASGGMRDVVAALDFSSPDGRGVSQGLVQLGPGAYGNAALTSLGLQRLLSDLLLPQLWSGGAVEGRRSFLLPYAATGHQRGEGNVAHAGVLAGLEYCGREGVTLGAHVAFDHAYQGGTLSGESFLAGVQGRYAPPEWGGWNLFGMGRLGAESMRMKRQVAFDLYHQRNTADWTGLSGALRLGGAYDAAWNRLRFGPFAALDYAFAARPGLSESGGEGSRLRLNSAGFQSLRSSLGLRFLTNNPGPSRWNFQAFAAWNHEWLNRAGSMRAAFVEAPAAAFSHTVKFPARDSMSFGAGVNVMNAAGVTFSLNGGGEASRRASSFYGNLSLGWSF